MAIPSRESFEHFFTIVEWQPPKVFEDINYKIDILSKEKVTEIVDIVEAYKQEFSKQVTSHEISDWIDSQPNFKRAIDSLLFRSRTKKNKPLTQHELREFLINKIHDECNPVVPISKYACEFTVERWTKPSRSFHVQIGIIKALYSYYHTDRYSRIYQASKYANELVKSTSAGLNRLKEMSDLMEFSNWGVDFLSKKNGERFIDIINSLSFDFPFKRNDESLKERVLIYDLNSLFSRYYKVSKSNAIFHLLMLEGIENNIDKRTIEKMLAKWRARY